MASTSGSGPLSRPGIIRGERGYDGPMSEPTNEPTDSDRDSAGTETPDVGLISDEQLPDDLQPEKNPLARAPGEEPDSEGESEDPSAEVEGMPDMGQPGAGA